MQKHRCSICNNDFYSSSKRRIYCSVPCRDIGRRRKAFIISRCSLCDKEFEAYLFKIKEGRMYCSRSCAGKINHSKKIVSPKEVGKKISLTMRGRTPKNIKLLVNSGNKFRFTSENRKGKTPTKGMKFGIETRTRKSDKMKGKKHWNWQGGKTKRAEKIRKSLKYKIWREKVFKRDNWKCVWCGKGGELNADHIKPFSRYPKSRYVLKNGRTLCIPCHKKTKTWGRRATTCIYK